jgi:predicted anti-sigma-YlaC factor YlaD
MLSCEVVTDLMAVYESGEASAETRRLVDEHLAGCAACRGAFGKNARVESAITRSKSTPAEKPVNGAKFVSKTRRLWFLVGAGVALLLAAQAAVFMRVFARSFATGVGSPLGFPGFPAGAFPVAPGPALLIAAAVAAVYIAFVISTARRPQVSRDGAVARAVIGGVLLAVLALLTLILWVIGPPVPGLLAFALLFVAIAVTAVRLSRLPYFTIATVVSLFAALVVLLNAVLVSRMIGRF